MIIEKSLQKTGMTLNADALPKEHRNLRSFRRLIAAMRAAEADVLDQLSEAERKLNASLEINLKLQEENHKIESTLRQFKVSQRLSEIDVLSTAEKQRLIEVA